MPCPAVILETYIECGDINIQFLLAKPLFISVDSIWEVFFDIEENRLFGE